MQHYGACILRDHRRDTETILMRKRVRETGTDLGLRTWIEESSRPPGIQGRGIANRTDRSPRTSKGNMTETSEAQDEQTVAGDNLDKTPG